MARSDKPDQEPTYEEARDELAKIVSQLESGNVPLSESLALWEKGENLADICQLLLDGASAKLTARESSDASRGD
jgi:exodeoxyribonuclease VII small subunit